MKKHKILFALLVVMLLAYTCDDVLEEDITDDAVTIIYPTQGEVVTGNTVTFSWRALDGADDYRIQIINSLQQNELDSLVSTTNFTYVLDAGTYQWRIKGENFAYETPYNFPVDFSVETSEDLSNQLVDLVTPSDDSYTNTADFIFTWQEVANATSYNFELLKNLNGLETVTILEGITNTNTSIDSALFDEDAEYIWKVKAVNATSSTEFFQHTLFLDRQAPNQPSLVTPLDEEIFTGLTINFNWTNGTDTGNVQSNITNTIEISTDFDFNTILDSSTTANNSSQYIFTEIGTYFWRVIAEDEAGNISDVSSIRTFFIE